MLLAHNKIEMCQNIDNFWTMVKGYCLGNYTKQSFNKITEFWGICFQHVLRKDILQFCYFNSCIQHSCQLSSDCYVYQLRHNFHYCSVGRVFYSSFLVWRERKKKRNKKATQNLVEKEILKQIFRKNKQIFKIRNCSNT